MISFYLLFSLLRFLACSPSVFVFHTDSEQTLVFPLSVVGLNSFSEWLDFNRAKTQILIFVLGPQPTVSVQPHHCLCSQDFISTVSGRLCVKKKKKVFVYYIWSFEAHNTTICSANDIQIFSYRNLIQYWLNSMSQICKKCWQMFFIPNSKKKRKRDFFCSLTNPVCYCFLVIASFGLWHHLPPECLKDRALISYVDH